MNYYVNFDFIQQFRNSLTCFAPLFLQKKIYFSLRVAPWALRKSLNWVKNNYGNTTVYVTASEVSEDVASPSEYHTEYINEILKGIDSCRFLDIIIVLI